MVDNETSCNSGHCSINSDFNIDEVSSDEVSSSFDVSSSLIKFACSVVNLLVLGLRGAFATDLVN